MSRPLCTAPRCRSLGHHYPDCADESCRGCQPRLAADGLNLCPVHTRGIAEDATRAAEIYVELVLVLSGTGAPGEKTSGSKEVGAVLNERAVESRTLIRHTLVSWCRLVSEERGTSLPADDITSLGAYAATHAQWLAAHPAAGECADELHELAHGRPWRTAYPSGARVVVVGACPLVSDDGPCGHILRAIMRRTDSLLPSELVCDAEIPHQWPADQWLTLGRKLRRAA